MAQKTPYALTYCIEESVEARGLSSAREIFLALNVSKSINLLKYLL